MSRLISEETVILESKHTIIKVVSFCNKDSAECYVTTAKLIFFSLDYLLPILPSDFTCTSMSANYTSVAETKSLYRKNSKNWDT